MVIEIPKIINDDDPILKNYTPRQKNENKSEVVFYIKKCPKKNINQLTEICKKNNIQINIYNTNKGIKESDLRPSILNSKFAIILESETSLSLIIKKCAVADVPVFVFGKHIPDEWNDELGFYVTENNSIINKFETFIDNYKNYNPRKYIID